MTLEKFKEKHKNLIDLGVIYIESSPSLGVDTITIDRFDGKDFLCDAKELTSPRNDVKKMGYKKGHGTGLYQKTSKDISYIEEDIRKSSANPKRKLYNYDTGEFVVNLNSNEFKEAKRKRSIQVYYDDPDDAFKSMIIESEKYGFYNTDDLEKRCEKLVHFGVTIPDHYVWKSEHIFVNMFRFWRYLGEIDKK